VQDDPGGQQSEPQQGESAAARTDIRSARGRTFLPEVTGVDFSSSRRGYDRAEVDSYVERVSRIVVELEAMRSPDAVIERALADVGEETSSILRRARKAAEEIIADAEEQARVRSEQTEAQAWATREDADRYAARVKGEGEKVLGDARAEAEKALGDARAEAEKALGDARAEAERTGTQATADGQRVREDADRYREQVLSHIEQLAKDRHRLIEDLRKLADQFHRTADRALEQIPEEPSREIAYERVEGNGGAAPTEARSA
jgi:DivIVA domain-containing protein